MGTTDSADSGGARARTMRTAAAAAAAGLGWLFAAWSVAPSVIRSAYGRTSIPLLNDLITGQNNNPVERYLEMWADWRVPVTIAVLLALAAVVATAPYHGAMGRRVVAALRREPTADGRTLALVGASVGWIGGLLEAARRLASYATEPSGPGLELLWMSPTAGAAAGAATGILLAALGGRRGLSLRAASTVLLTLCAYSFLRTLGFGIHPLAALLLALGLAHQTAGWLSARTAGARRVAARSVPLMIVASGVVAGGLWSLEGLRAARGTAALGPTPSGEPNVLLLVLDTQRASRMSLYGHTRETTPRIDRLAEGGVVFDHAMSTTSWTLPGHASMLTGRWASELRADWDVPLDDADPTLAEVLAGRGYATGAFIGNTYFASARSGLARGFHVYRDHAVTLHDWVNSVWWTGRLVLWARRSFGEHRRARKRAPDINRQFLGWLDAVDRPYFAMLNYFDVHDRFDAPAPFDTIYRDPAPRFWLPNWFQQTDYSEGDVAEMLDAYDSSVRYLDHHVGALLDSLEARGTLDNTVVVLTSDHGEHFGERDIVSHGNSLYLQGVQVPLVIAAPGVARGRRSATPVSVRDIPATVLAMLGAPCGAMPGRPLLVAGDGLGGEAHWVPRVDQDEAVLLDLTARSFFMPQDPVRFGAMRGAVLDSLHYIVDGRGQEELFNIRRDPDERYDLLASTKKSPELERLRAAVRSRPRWP